MKTTATEFKTKLGEFIQKAMAEPVMIEKNHRTAAVLVSIDEYNRLIQIEDNYWAESAVKAAKNGFLGPKESMKFIKAALNAKA